MHKEKSTPTTPPLKTETPIPRPTHPLNLQGHNTAANCKQLTHAPPPIVLLAPAVLFFAALAPTPAEGVGIRRADRASADAPLAAANILVITTSMKRRLMG